MWLSLGFFLFCVNAVSSTSADPNKTENGIALINCDDNSELSPVAKEEEEEVVVAADPSRSGLIRAIKYPCICGEGQCGCCSGNILENFNFNMKQRFCLNLTYDSEEAAVGMKFSFNEITLYKSSVSGRNPPPVCVPIPYFTSVRFCIRLTNVYFINRNFHACVTVESQWKKQPAFTYNFDCIRIGLNGLAVVSPEQGGGLPEPVSPDVDNIEEYDELLENQATSTKKPSSNKKKNKTRTTTTEKPITLTILR